METCRASLIPMKFLLNPNGDRKFLERLRPLGGHPHLPSGRAEVSHPQGVFINSQHYRYVSPSDALWHKISRKRFFFWMVYPRLRPALQKAKKIFALSFLLSYFIPLKQACMARPVWQGLYGKACMARPVWQGVSTDSLNFQPGPPCPTLLRPPLGGPPQNRT
jgi:hypothetical protein